MNVCCVPVRLLVLYTYGMDMDVWYGLLKCVHGLYSIAMRARTTAHGGSSSSTLTSTTSSRPGDLCNANIMTVRGAPLDGMVACMCLVCMCYVRHVVVAAA